MIIFIKPNVAVEESLDYFLFQIFEGKKVCDLFASVKEKNVYF
jgi:hypothetical protein